MPSKYLLPPARHLRTLSMSARTICEPTIRACDPFPVLARSSSSSNVSEMLAVFEAAGVQPCWTPIQVKAGPSPVTITCVVVVGGSKRQVIPHPALHYSEVIRADDLVFSSGQSGTDEDGRLPADQLEQVNNAFKNLGKLLESVGASVCLLPLPLPCKPLSRFLRSSPTFYTSIRSLSAHTQSAFS
jgi:hypothetical protein